MMHDHSLCGPSAARASSVRRALVHGAGAALVLAGAQTAHAQYVRTDLVSDQSGVAAHIDPNLVNAWGLAFNPTGFAWVANNHSGTSTLYDGNGVPQSLVVNIPASPASTGGPATGVVFNGSNGFFLNPINQTAPAAFIFATENGTIAAWNPTVGTPPTPSTQALTMADRSGAGSIYKGLAISPSANGNRLFAADFHNGRVDVFNNDFSYNSSASSAFVDPNLPSGYAPFNATTLNNKIYVSYAQQDAMGEDDVPGIGHGFIDIFNTDGTLDHRLVSQGALNSPWGMTIAPANFGAFSGDLLVGNFGDGLIHAYDPTTGALLGTLSGANNQPIVIPGLWALEFGNGVQNQPLNSLFFTAGPDGEMHGLYGSIALPAPGSVLVLGLAGLAAGARRRRA